MSSVLTVEVVPMVRAHLGAVLAIDALVYPKPWSASLYKQELRSNERVHLTALIDGVVVGHGGLMLLHDEGHVSTVAVDPDWQRRGVARRLMVGLCRAAIERGMAAMTLEVRVSNRPAQELYRQFGFAPAGVRQNYYVDDDEDALIMWAADIQSQDYRLRLGRAAAGETGEQP